MAKNNMEKILARLFPRPIMDTLKKCQCEEKRINKVRDKTKKGGT